MTAATWYALVGALLVALGLHGAVARRHLLRKVLALNVAASGVFLVLVAPGARGPTTDPVPQAMVITGIVVAVSASALAIWLARRLHAETGRAALPEAEDGDA
ncbi:MAG: NADH-quinone oxidoreductase subunit K [Planctomycetes bacterium]|nr:NADH-quinone oxidoreductase subunit K [Planctomycetota bacterium]